MMDKDESDNDNEDGLMNEFQRGGTNYQSNMIKYIENYGITIPVPGMYIFDSKINPLNNCEII